MGISTMLVTKQKAESGECKKSVYRLPLWAVSERRRIIARTLTRKTMHNVSTSERGWHFLWGHEDHQRLIKVPGNVRESGAVVRIHHDEGGSSGEGMQVPGI
jgi:hypothetical protein